MFELPKSWQNKLQETQAVKSLESLKDFLQEEIALEKKIYPPFKKVFTALELTPFDKVKIVILGQDPYHGLGQAHGLAFSVLPPTPPPPSLVNIFKEIERDFGKKPQSNGNLESWATQGVLLLNTVLTVRDGEPASHQKKGWEVVTDEMIKALNAEAQGLVFLLWGAHAQKKQALLDSEKHLILSAPHPSPLSVYRGFAGCAHFSKANDYLIKQGLTPIDWTA